MHEIPNALNFCRFILVSVASDETGKKSLRGGGDDNTIKWKP